MPTYGGSLLEVGEEEILQMKDCNGLFMHKLSPTIKYNKSLSVPIVAVFTKYDVLVESLKPSDEEDFYGNIEKEIEDLVKGVDHDMGLNTGTSSSHIDPDLLSLAEKKLCEMITPFEEKLSVPWVKVSGLYKLPFFLSVRSNLLILKTANNAFSDTLDELEDVTKRRINNSLELLWAINQEQSVAPKIKSSIEFVLSPSACDIKRLC